MDQALQTGIGLLTGVALGSMVFFAAVVAPLIFMRLPEETAGRFIRQLFPVYYLFLGGLTAVAAALALATVPLHAALLGLAAAGFLYARQLLMPRINPLRDRELAGDASAAPLFARLHRRSVVLNTVQMVVLLIVVLRALGASAAVDGGEMPVPDPAPVPTSKSVLGEPLRDCSLEPPTGFYRDGCCETGPDDRGRHVVCAEVTAEFLEFTASRGNDLATPRPGLRFPGLRPGDRWCLCALRWREALEAGVAPPVDLAATHEKVLDFVGLDDLRRHALPRREASTR